MKQTAVEWLMQQLPTIDKYDPYYQNLFTQAKEMEKEQIEDAYYQGDADSYKGDAEQYYNKTFKSE